MFHSTVDISDVSFMLSGHAVDQKKKDVTTYIQFAPTQTTARLDTLLLLLM